jgi:hypothetical protein
MIKAAWFRTYAANERPALFDRVVQSWDTANKATELSDFSVCTSWGITGNDLYLLHVLRRRMEYPELQRAVLEQAEAFNATVVLIEDKASGTQLIRELVEPGLHAVTRYQPRSDKVMRPDRDDRERLWSTRPPRCSTGSSKPAARRRHLPILQGARSRAADRAARAAIGDGEAAGPAAVVTEGSE